MYDVFSHLHFGQKHTSLHDTKSTTDLSPYEILGMKSCQMGVWSLICLYSAGHDIKTLKEPCLDS